MDNYQFCVKWLLEQPSSKGARVLDYGCGVGQIVMQLREKQFDAFGCDVFFEGGDYSRFIEDGLLGGVIIKMEEDRIPFGDEYFDFIINNQVMEHVQDLDQVLAEMDRVLKPGGIILSLFPDRSVWREGHCGILFLHWFPKGSKFRIYYAASIRALGFGYHKKDKGVMQWSRDFCEYLDRWTHYRDLGEIRCAYSKRFKKSAHIEEYWLRQRLGDWEAILSVFPAKIQRSLVRRFCGLVFEVVKPSI